MSRMSRMRSQEQQDYLDMLAECHTVLAVAAAVEEDEYADYERDNTEPVSRALIAAMRAISKVLANLMLD